MISLQTLSGKIPGESTWVRTFFDYVNKDNSSGKLGRYGCAFLAIASSTANLIGYDLLIINRLSNAVIYRDSKELIDDCYSDAKRALDSLYFAAGLTALIFSDPKLTLFKPKKAFQSSVP